MILAKATYNRLVSTVVVPEGADLEKVKERLIKSIAAKLTGTEPFDRKTVMFTTTKLPGLFSEDIDTVKENIKAFDEQIKELKAQKAELETHLRELESTL